MIKLYLPNNKKSNIKGLWYNAKAGRVDFDNIRIEARSNLSIDNLEGIKRLYSQEALFYTNRGKAYIYHNRAKIEVLRHYNRAIIKRGNFRQLRAKIKEYIALYNGLTVFKQYNQYLIEAWQ